MLSILQPCKTECCNAKVQQHRLPSKYSSFICSWAVNIYKISARLKIRVAALARIAHLSWRRYINKYSTAGQCASGLLNPTFWLSLDSAIVISYQSVKMKKRNISVLLQCFIYSIWINGVRKMYITVLSALVTLTDPPNFTGYSTNSWTNWNKSACRKDKRTFLPISDWHIVTATNLSWREKPRFG